MAVKVPPMLHKMSVAAQKAWYKKNKMEYPGAAGKEGRSAAQAKKDVGEINKKKAREAAIAAAAKASKKNKALVSSSERVREMGRRRRESGEGLGGGLETNRDILSYVRAGGTIKAGRLGEAAKPDASMAMTDQLKKKMITDKDKQTLGKVADLMRSLRNKDKKIEEGVATAQKVMDRANAVAKTNPDPKKRYAAARLADKARLRTINPTGVNTGIVRGGGNKTYRMVTGKVPPYQLKPKTGVSEETGMNEETASQKEPPFTPDKKVVRRGPGGPMSQAKWLAKQAMLKKMKSMKDVKEEVEQVDEMEMNWGMRTRQKLKSMNMKPSGQKKPVGPEDVKKIINVPPVKKKEVKEEVGYIEEKLTAGDPASKWISDFVASDNPKFEGKSKKERINMALGAYYAATGKSRKNEDLEEALDPVGKEDKDIDNDGDSDKTDVYLSRRRKAISSAIRKKVAKKMGK